MQNENWGCCSVRNKDEIIYFTQSFFGLLLSCFSMYQISINDARDNNVWVAMLSSTVAVFLPAPTMRQERLP